jgi:hypothetical protein
VAIIPATATPGVAPPGVATSRRRKDPLRPLADDGRRQLARLSRGRAAPAARAARAALPLAVAGGPDYQQAARAAGRPSGDAVPRLVARSNRGGPAAPDPRHGGGRKPAYDTAARDRTPRGVARAPTPGADGTATRSLTTPRRVPRAAPDGLPTVPTFPIGQARRGAEYTSRRTRTGCPAGPAVRRRKAGAVTATGPDAAARKS